MAIMTASVPELQKRILSNDGTRLHRSSASATSLSVGMVQAVPWASWAVTASVMAGWAWPWISEAKLLTRFEEAVAVDIGDPGALAAAGIDRIGRLPRRDPRDAAREYF